MKNKRGLIKITNELYENYWNIIGAIFSEFKPRHMEFRHWENNTWYFWGTCDKFDECDEACIAPVYDVIFTRHDDGTYTYEFRKHDL